MITTVTDACVFVRQWFGWADELAGGPITAPFEVPDAIKCVNRQLGKLWLPNHDLPEPEVDLFSVQDRLVSPHCFEQDADGVVAAIWENQYVWGCGFKPSTGSQLWVSGDWPDAQSDMGAWRPTPDRVDTPIIFVLLANMMWASEMSEMDDADKRPTGIDRPLWRVGPWHGFDGFWINDARDIIRMQGLGWGLTAWRT